MELFSAKEKELLKKIETKSGTKKEIKEEVGKLLASQSQMAPMEALKEK